MTTHVSVGWPIAQVHFLLFIIIIFFALDILYSTQDFVFGQKKKKEVEKSGLQGEEFRREGKKSFAKRTPPVSQSMQERGSVAE